MLSPARAIALACVTAVLVPACLAGCGGGSKTTGSTGKTSASAASGGEARTDTGKSASTGGFMERAEGICRDTNARLARTQPKGKSPEQIATAVVENETIERKANGRLAQLTPPATLTATWRKVLAYRRSLANQLGSLAAASRNHSTPSVQRLGVSKKRLHGELRALATKTGFKDCAKVGSH